MNEKRKEKVARREKEQAKQGQRVVRGIFIALILLALAYVFFVTTNLT